MVGAADNGVAVDKLFGERRRLLIALLAVRAHVVTIGEHSIWALYEWLGEAMA